ncbi:MAG: glycosyltransferase, partial [Proteobacteria bacterium]|nr:glycosyltransferase [Pseudomonadota bacterium]
LNGDRWSDVFRHQPATGQWIQAIGQGGGGFLNVAGQWASGWEPHPLDLDGDDTVDLLLFNAHVVHGSSSNYSTDRPRRAFSSRWCDDTVLFEARHATMPLLWDHGLSTGDRVGGSLFPQVLPELLHASLWAQPIREPSTTPTIGFLGQASDAANLALIEDALVNVSTRLGSRVRFVFIGCVTPTLAALPGVRVLPEPLDYPARARVMHEAGLDIALAPLRDTAFNRCKGRLRWLEYSAAGAAGIYSDLPGIRESVSPGRTGLLVGSAPEAWASALEQLALDDPGRDAGLHDQDHLDLAHVDFVRLEGALGRQPAHEMGGRLLLVHGLRQQIEKRLAVDGQMGQDMRIIRRQGGDVIVEALGGDAHQRQIEAVGAADQHDRDAPGIAQDLIDRAAAGDRLVQVAQ